MIAPLHALQRRIRSRAADIRGFYRQHGWEGTRAKLAMKLRSALYSRRDEIILVKRLDGDREPARPSRLRVETLRSGHLSRLRAWLEGSALGAADARAAAARHRRFERYVTDGYHGFVAFADRDPVGYYWWLDRTCAQRHPHVRQLRLELGDDDVYGWEFFLDAPHRGGGNAVAVLDEVERRLAALGFRRLWGSVLAENRPARWLYTITGYEPVRTLTTRTVFSIIRLRDVGVPPTS